MSNSLRLAIPKSCHEEWRNIKSTPQGGFCDLCQREVVDFTNWSEEQLKVYFKSKPSNVCGRFYEHQLKRYTYGRKRLSVNHWLFAVFGLTVIALREGSAQIPRTNVNVEQRQSDFKLEKTPPDSTISISKTFASMDTTVVKYNFQALSHQDTGVGTRNIEYLINGTIGRVVYPRPWYSPRRWWSGVLDLFDN